MAIPLGAVRRPGENEDKAGKPSLAKPMAKRSILLMPAQLTNKNLIEGSTVSSCGPHPVSIGVVAPARTRTPVPGVIANREMSFDMQFAK
jgi:hypothetical protein